MRDIRNLRLKSFSMLLISININSLGTMLRSLELQLRQRLVALLVLLLIKIHEARKRQTKKLLLEQRHLALQATLMGQL